MTNVKAKICGITNKEDALKAVFYGAWAIGFVFHKKSPRYISPSKARLIIEALPPFVTPVGVFVDLSERAAREICRFARISTVQFHGSEDPAYCKRFKDCKVIKSFRVDQFFDVEVVKKYKVDAYLFDTYQENVVGGTGKAFNWHLLKDKKFDKPVILAGGLNPENIVEAVATVNPYAVDVSSGVEQSPGIKNPQKIHAFFDSLKNV